MFMVESYRIRILLSLAAMACFPPVLAYGQSNTEEDLKRAAERTAREKEREKERQDRIQRLIANLTAKVQDTSDLVDRLEAKASTVLLRMNSLLTNDDGKRLARDDAAVLHFMELQNKPDVTMEEIQARKKSIRMLLEGLKSGVQEAGALYVPDEKVVADTAEIFNWARDHLAALNADENWINTVIARAPKDLDLKARKILRDIIADTQAREIDARNAARLKARRGVQVESEKKVAEAERIAQLEKSNAEAERVIREMREQLERQRIEHEMDTKRNQIVQEKKIAELEHQLAEVLATRARQKAESEVIAKKGDEDAEKIRKRHRCQQSDIKAKFAPFTTPGYSQPDGTMTLDKRPISLSKLRAIGALRETPEGLGMLLAAAEREGEQLRPRWAYTLDPYALQATSPKDYEYVVQAQKDLIELGDTMVELGMLDK